VDSIKLHQSFTSGVQATNNNDSKKKEISLPPGYRYIGLSMLKIPIDSTETNFSLLLLIDMGFYEEPSGLQPWAG